MVACTLCAFISLVWLREQIVMNGGPEWLEPNVVEPLPQLQGVGGGLFGGAHGVCTRNFKQINFKIFLTYLITSCNEKAGY